MFHYNGGFWQNFWYGVTGLFVLILTCWIVYKLIEVITILMWSIVKLSAVQAVRGARSVAHGVAEVWNEGQQHVATSSHK